MEGVSSQTKTNNKARRNKQLPIQYYNARSLIPNFGDLCAFVEIYKADVIWIVETWLNSDLSDSELTIAGFQLYRRDRHRHGGGVLIYTSEFLEVRMLP